MQRNYTTHYGYGHWYLVIAKEGSGSGSYRSPRVVENLSSPGGHFLLNFLVSVTGPVKSMGNLMHCSGHYSKMSLSRSQAIHIRPVRSENN